MKHVKFNKTKSFDIK